MIISKTPLGVSFCGDMYYNMFMGRIGQIPWNKDRVGVYSEETLARMRLSAQSDVSTEKIIELYKQGKSCNEIAKILGTNYTVAWRRLVPTGLLRDKGCGSRGKKRSLKTRKRMSKAQKLLKNDPEFKKKHSIGKNNPFYKKKHKPETIEAMKRKLSIMFSGKNNPQWIDGRSFEPYTSAFKREIRHQIYIRDGYACQKCGITYEPGSGRLVAHHKDGNKKNCSMDNLITLCRVCHGILHGENYKKRRTGMVDDN